MRIEKLADGTLLVPIRAESEATVGDALLEVRPGDPNYETYLSNYEDEVARLGTYDVD